MGLLAWRQPFYLSLNFIGLLLRIYWGIQFFFVAPGVKYVQPGPTKYSANMRLEF